MIKPKSVSRCISRVPKWLLFAALAFATAGAPADLLAQTADNAVRLDVLLRGWDLLAQTEESIRSKQIPAPPAVPASLAGTVPKPSSATVVGHSDQKAESGGTPAAAYNTPGNILIADQFNNRVVEVDQNHNLVWQFGTGSTKASPNSVIAPNDVERVGDLTLIAGTGAPPGLEPQCPGGCPDNRVLVVNQAGEIVWQYGQAGVAGSGANELNSPVSAVFLPTRHILITDQGNERVIELTQIGKRIVWQYGTTGVAGSGFNQLNNPNSAELLPNGNILIADEGNNRVIEVNRNQQIVWQYGNPSDTSILNGPGFASRVGLDTLITDGLNSRVVEVNPSGTVDFTYYTNSRPGSVSAPAPSHSVRLYNGNTLISDQINNQVIEVDPQGNIVFSQGEVNVAGTGFNQLNWPYDAKMIGDYTGITAPDRTFFELPKTLQTLFDNPFFL